MAPVPCVLVLRLGNIGYGSEILAELVIFGVADHADATMNWNRACAELFAAESAADGIFP